MTISPEVLTALATLGLAVVTVVAILSPIIQRNRERVRETQAALRQFRFLLQIYQRRLGIVAADPHVNAAGLLNGLDVIWGQAFSSDLGRMIPQSMAMTDAYLAVINAQDALVLAAQQQSGNPVRAMQTAQAAVEKLNYAADMIYIERGRYDLKAAKLFPHWFKRIEMVPAFTAPDNIVADTASSEGVTPE